MKKLTPFQTFKAASAAEITGLKGDVCAAEAAANRQKNRAVDAEKCLETERRDHNHARDLLHDAELENAGLRGTLDQMQRTHPPVMVPMPIGSNMSRAERGSGISETYFDAASGRDMPRGQRWWHR